jgi:hypothetical protein
MNWGMFFLIAIHVDDIAIVFSLLTAYRGNEQTDDDCEYCTETVVIVGGEMV